MATLFVFFSALIDEYLHFRHRSVHRRLRRSLRSSDCLHRRNNLRWIGFRRNNRRWNDFRRNCCYCSNDSDSSNCRRSDCSNCRSTCVRRSYCRHYDLCCRSSLPNDCCLPSECCTNSNGLCCGYYTNPNSCGCRYSANLLRCDYRCWRLRCGCCTNPNCGSWHFRWRCECRPCDLLHCA